VAERRIQHVVVLMLENRSFDHLLGFLDHPSPEFPGLTPAAHANPVDPADRGSRQVAVTPDAGYSLPVDPPHSHKSALEQMGLTGTGRARMNGFVSAYERKASGHEERPVIHVRRLEGLVLAAAGAVSALTARFGGRLRRLWALVFVALGAGLSTVLWRWKKSVEKVEVVEGVGPEIMKCLAPDKIPVLGTLARDFAICTRWHCSVPGETWPNRNFLHSATSDGTVDIEIGLYESPTVFERLESAGADWRVYHDGRAHLWAFQNTWLGDRIANWFAFGEFERHVAADDLAAYTFIEPNHQGPRSNSQHPGNNVRPQPDSTDFERGERLVASIYEALRRNPQVFEKTLFLVTYDEHGGLFDHEPPPRAPAPAPLNRRRISLTRRFVSWFIERDTVRFTFRTLGARVPTIIVSPWIDAATLDDRLYDHASVAATLRLLFAPDAKPLTRRDAAANTFEHLVNGRSTPRTGGDLPDLSARAGATTRTASREAPSPEADGDGAARDADRGAEPAGTTPLSDDDFARQLDVLAARMRQALGTEAAAAPGSAGNAAARAADGSRRAAPAPPPGPDADVVGEFLAQAQARRSTGSPG